MRGSRQAPRPIDISGKGLDRLAAGPAFVLTGFIASLGDTTAVYVQPRYRENVRTQYLRTGELARRRLRRVL